MIKTLLKILAGLILLLVVAVAGFLYTFDANSYKEEIADLAEAAVGRPISIAGNMEVSLYPWLGIKIGDVTIGNAAGFSKDTFASIGQFDVRIKLVPLLQKRLEIDRLVLHRLSADFERNAAGEENWTGFAGVSDSHNTPASNGLTGLVVGGIDLADARFGWRDVNTGREFRISNLSLSTQALTEGQPLPVEFKGYVESNQPQWQAAVKAKAALEFDSDAPVFHANGLKLSVKALLPGEQKDTLSAALVADSTIDLQTQSARLTKARVGIFGLVLSGVFDIQDIFAVPVIQGPITVKPFSADALAKQLKFEMPPMANPQALTNIALAASFRTDFVTVQLNDVRANLDQSRVEGFMHFTGGSRSMLRYDLKIDAIDLDDYRLAGTGSGQSESPLPLNVLRRSDLEGVLAIATLTTGEKAFSDVHITTRIEDGVLTANPIALRVNSGEIRGAFQLDARDKPAAELVAEVTGVDAQATLDPLLKEITGNQALKLEGLVNADVKIKASGAGMTALKRTAAGTMTLTMNKAVVEGIDFDHASRDVVADYAKRNAFRMSRRFMSERQPQNRTEFSKLAATLKLAHGKLVNNDLSLVSDKVKVSGSGTVDFLKRRLDYRPVIDMNVTNTLNVRDKLRDHPMEYRVTGAFGDLATAFDVGKYDLLVGRMMIREAKAKRNRRINSQSTGSWTNALSD